MPQCLLRRLLLSVHSNGAMIFGRSYKVLSRLWVTTEGAAGAETSATDSAKTASILSAAIASLRATISDNRIALAAADVASATIVAAVAEAVGLAAVGAAVSAACPHRSLAPARAW